MLAPAWGLILWLFAGTAFPSMQTPFVDRRLWWFGTGDSKAWRLFETRPAPQAPFPERLVELTLSDGTSQRGILTRPVFRLCLADIDGDGCDEILAGIDRLINGRSWRRVYVYGQERSTLKPLWLGSKLIHRLVDFNVEPTSSGSWLLKTHELSGSKTLIGRYRWDQFGFRTVAMQEEK